ncbi:MAG: hypothetical protein Q8L48_19015 [Archangium sp.]|nr:hypothetical protein [Archangium sp.]
MVDLSNADLRRAQVPGPQASWQEIEHFALTFDGYQRIGQRLGALAEQHRAAGTLPHELDELRGCLFLEQRRWRHFQSVPDEKAMQHIRALVEEIRRQLMGMTPSW